MQRRTWFASLSAAVLAASLPLGAAAQESGALRIVVPFPPGGATDMVPRNMQDVLSRLLGQPVVIENKAGAGGSIGMTEVARATDGLTFGVATLSTHGVNPAVYKKLPYDAVKDFVGVTEVVKAPGVIVINPSIIPVKNFAELVAYLKAHPGKVSYATPGNGTIGHMWGAQFIKSTGVDMVHIPYRGAGPAVNDVLGGQVPVYFDQVASSLPHVKAGKLRAIAVSWSERLAVLPDVPTYKEVGHPELNDPSWFGLVAPKSTPPEQMARVQKAVAEALKDPAVKQRMDAQGLFVSGTSSADFTKQIASEVAKMKGVAAAAGISID
ncbi:tripartite tricarboxylate transporter substrate binding protein BugE [Comamonas aquatica]|uniref:Bug family tripartite tricarboxylate transporter substrate binding protein n=1 Tax=Comamonas aquatica TaxID=225991 RepID=UPI002449721C|nr:tripartite tricarboxylate transporter substrate binding protein BugE [Comamonas aquatica]MDH0898280.1 tripartite tricarboxylate transporter substrate binding protein BugE [Comamonas aquatica]MDH1378611.1 tripartite tricarboxylate transporter substrate binding protein BugE [Comamonas aquatica]MDH1638424.1 tripartite tricarboxylate transporter substrate binding protein BugE [Comamonas aquatica]MDH1812763.1 tripartite tricarboxylate transporter substrate binding protein BugE [Comamonas aquatica